MGNATLFGCMCIQGNEFILSTITMTELHGFFTLMNLITEFDGKRHCTKAEAKVCSTTGNGGWNRKYARSFYIKQKERRLLRYSRNSYNVVEIVREVQWNEERIRRLESLIARFAKMSTDPSEHLSNSGFRFGWYYDECLALLGVFLFSVNEVLSFYPDFSLFLYW